MSILKKYNAETESWNIVDLSNGGLNKGTPVGSVFWWPTGTPPEGALLCNGDTISRSVYPYLYNVIGTNYNSTDIIPALIGANDAPWVVTCSSQAEPAYMAFNHGPGNNNERWRANASTGWIKITNSAAIPFTVASYSIQGNSESSYVNRSPKSWVLKDADGNTIDTQTAQTGWTTNEIRTYTLATPITTTALLFDSMTCNQDYLVIQELKIYGPTPDNYTFGLPSFKSIASGANPYIQASPVTSLEGESFLYGCRAWVTFDGITNNNVTGTYSQSGTTVTVTLAAHGHLIGHQIQVDITSGTGVDGTYTITAVDTHTFTYTAGTSLTTSGNITLVRATIRGSGNIHSVAYVATGNYTINFASPMAHANYAFNANVSETTGQTDVAAVSASDLTAVTTKYINIIAEDLDGGYKSYPIVSLTIFY